MYGGTRDTTPLHSIPPPAPATSDNGKDIQEYYTSTVVRIQIDLQAYIRSQIIYCQIIHKFKLTFFKIIIISYDELFHKNYTLIERNEEYYLKEYSNA